MAKAKSTFLALVAVLVTPMAANAVPIEVTISGTADTTGDSAFMSFLLDSDNFLNSLSFPTRGYVIDPSSFQLTLGSTTYGLISPKATTSYFVLRDNDPAVDGFFLSEDSVDFPFDLPLDTGGLSADFLATYGQDLLSSLDILDALGTYNFAGILVSSFNINSGSSTFASIGFESMTIRAATVPEPGTLALLGIGLLGMAATRRRKSS